MSEKPTLKRVVVIGIGGIGGCVLNTLPRFLNFSDPGCRLVLIDGDSFESGNQDRQAFAECGNKAVVKAAELELMFNQIVISPEACFIEPDNVRYHIEENDIVFLCVDNSITRKQVSDYCSTLKNVCLISGGNDFDDGNIQLYVRKNGQNLTLPLANEFHPEVEFPEDKNPAERGCDERIKSDPQLLFTNNFIAALMVNAFYAFSQGVVEFDEVYADMLHNKALPVNRTV